MSPGRTFREQRRSRRFRHDLIVDIHEKNQCQRVHTVDVARHGLFLATNVPPQERHLVQLTIKLPDAVIQAAASVTHTVRTATQIDGVGVQFFALSGEAKRRWDQYVHALQRTHNDIEAVLGSGASAPSPSSPWAPSPSGPQPPAPPLPALPLAQSAVEPDHSATFIIKLKSLTRLEEFASVHLVQGGMVLYTPVLYRPGEAVRLVCVHPASEEEFHLPGVVDAAHHDRPKRLDIHFTNVTPAVVERFRDFARTGQPPPMQMRMPGTAAEPDLFDRELELDVEVFDETIDLENDNVFSAHPIAVADLTLATEPRWEVAPDRTQTADPGFRPHTFVIRCSEEGAVCSAEPYTLVLGPCRGTLGLFADLRAFVSMDPPQLVSVPRFVESNERRARVQGFADAGGSLDMATDVATLLEVAALADPPRDPATGAPLSETRAATRVDAVARRLAEGQTGPTRMLCPLCGRGRMTVTRLAESRTFHDA